MLLRVPAVAAEDSWIQDEVLLLLAMLLIVFRSKTQADFGYKCVT